MNDANTFRDAPTRSDVQVRNPFGADAPLVAPLGALANAEQQRAIAEVQARMIIARANPRNPIKCMDLILQDCTRPTLASGALYQFARGGSAISGPSIRLAESIARRWGNIASGIKEVARSGGYSECVAYAWDLETGYYDERQFQVRHWRDTKQGGYVLTDERDIYELIANMGQRRKRAVLLTVIPGDVVEAATEQCEETLRSNADTSPEALRKMVDAFNSTFGVTQAQIEKRCQCRIEAVRPAQIVQLSKIFASLQDEMSSPKDWFDDAVPDKRVGVATSDAPARQADPKPSRAKAPDKAPDKAADKPAETKAPEDAQRQPKPAEPTTAADAQETAASRFEAYMADEHGELVNDEPSGPDDSPGPAVFHSPAEFLRAVYRRAADAGDVAKFLENNAEDIRIACEADPTEASGFNTAIDLLLKPKPASVAASAAASEPAQVHTDSKPATAPPAVLAMPQKGGRPDYGTYVAMVTAELGRINTTAGVIAFQEAHKAQFASLTTVIRKAAMQAIAKRAAEVAKGAPQPAADAWPWSLNLMTHKLDACTTLAELKELDDSGPWIDSYKALSTADKDALKPIFAERKRALSPKFS